MTVTTEAPWTASSSRHSLSVTWRPDLAQYVCEARMGTSVLEARFNTYPHEVLEWLRVWLTRGD
jgi:hypothetical protein